jgi:hypothetical protein
LYASTRAFAIGAEVKEYACTRISFSRKPFPLAPPGEERHRSQAGPDQRGSEGKAQARGSRIMMRRMMERRKQDMQNSTL